MFSHIFDNPPSLAFLSKVDLIVKEALFESTHQNVRFCPENLGCYLLHLSSGIFQRMVAEHVKPVMIRSFRDQFNMSDTPDAVLLQHM
jgi:hypothetical protein